jgi:hypothetical protein
MAQDVVWVAGARINVRRQLESTKVSSGPPSPADWQQGAMWRLAAGKWTRFDVGPGELRDIAAVSETEAWAVGSGLWHLSKGVAKQTPIELPSSDTLSSLWVGPSGEIWLATQRGSVFLRKQGQVHHVAQLDEPRQLEPLRGSGEHVWVTGGRCVWRWQRSAAAR